MDLAVDDLCPEGEDLLAAIRDRAVSCAVIGLGFIGSILMEALLEAGFEAHGCDRSAEALDRFRGRFAGRRTLRPWSVGRDPAAVAAAEVVLVAVRLDTRADLSADLEPLRSAAHTIFSRPSRARLVMIESTIPPGTTRSLAGECLGDRIGRRVFLAHCPERLQVGHTVEDLRSIPRLVGGVDSSSTRVAMGFLTEICEEVIPVSCPEVSELSKLLENAFIATGVALAGDFTRLAHSLGVSASEVTAAAATKPFGFHSFYPGPGVGGHCIPTDLRVLRGAARGLGIEVPLLEGAGASLANLPRLAVSRLEALVQACGERLAGARVLLVGVGFKLGSADTTQTPAREIARCLRSRGAVPVFLDSQVASLEVDGRLLARVDPETLAKDEFLAGMVVSGDRVVSGVRLQEAVRVLLDVGGGRIVSGGLPEAHRL